RTEMEIEYKTLDSGLHTLNGEKDQIFKDNSELSNKLVAASQNFNIVYQKMSKDTQEYDDKCFKIKEIVLQLDNVNKLFKDYTERSNRINRKVLFYDSNCNSCKNNKFISDNKPRLQNLIAKLSQINKENQE